MVACQAVANIFKFSLGPVTLDKVVAMSSSLVRGLPPKMNDLPPLTKSVIMNFEDMLQLAYPVAYPAGSSQ
ncbi:hypothetical protein CCACVL1_28180 [Corchorus capsularis]|uniref:Uncharacterized protein n=1 Tax=Corchorus capsularis TaxID=210143 RepID=A0A1R3G782_COCAP|nr:hypothetical protein CCACVL1_28180 [Corchorus capsularis]